MFDNMTDKEFYIWLAGFFDGEGNIYLPSKKTFSVNICIGNTNGEVIKAIHSRINLGQVAITKFKSEHWLDKYVWRIRTYLDAEYVLRQIVPYLYIKKKAAQEALGRIDRAKEQKQRLIQRNEMILSMLESGKTGVEVAKYFGISETLVAGIHTGRMKIGVAIRNRVSQDIPVWWEKAVHKSKSGIHNPTRTKIIAKPQ